MRSNIFLAVCHLQFSKRSPTQRIPFKEIILFFSNSSVGDNEVIKSLINIYHLFIIALKLTHV